MNDEPPSTPARASAGSTWDQHADRIIGGMAVLAFASGTLVYRVFEDWGWVDSFYFSAVALTTVGFGDFSPTTPFTKLFTVFYILGGISLIGLFLDQRLKRMARRVSDRQGAP